MNLWKISCSAGLRQRMLESNDVVDTAALDLVPAGESGDDFISSIPFQVLLLIFCQKYVADEYSGKSKNIFVNYFLAVYIKTVFTDFLICYTVKKKMIN